MKSKPGLIIIGYCLLSACVYSQEQQIRLVQATTIPSSSRSSGEFNPFADKKSQRILNLYDNRNKRREDEQAIEINDALDNAGKSDLFPDPDQALGEYLKRARDAPEVSIQSRPSFLQSPGLNYSSESISIPSQDTSEVEGNRDFEGSTGPSLKITGESKVTYCSIDLIVEATIDISGGRFQISGSGNSNKSCPGSNQSCCFTPPVDVRIAINGTYRGDKNSGTLNGECRDRVKDKSGETRFRRRVSGSLRNGTLHIQIEADQDDLLDRMKWTIRTE